MTPACAANHRLPFNQFRAEVRAAVVAAANVSHLYAGALGNDYC